MQKHKSMLSRFGFYILFFVSFVWFTLNNLGCNKNPVEPSDPPNRNPILNEDIPYDALGHGILAFTRGGFLFFLDADNKSWNAMGFSTGESEVSPNGKQIAYSRYVKGSLPYAILKEIFLMNIDGTNSRNISNLSRYCSNPHWVGDSSVLYFGGNDLLNLHSLNGQGRVPIDLSGLLNSVEEPSFGLLDVSASQTGKLAIVNGGELYKMDMDGKNLSLIKVGDLLDCPSWSPDGSSIAYMNSSIVNNRTELILISADGSNLRVLFTKQFSFDSLYDPGQICWSPDGSKIAFVMPTSNFIYVVNSDGSALTQVTSTLGVVDSNLSWFR